MSGLQNLAVSLPFSELEVNHPGLAENFPQPVEFLLTNLQEDPTSVELAALAMFVDQTAAPVSPFWVLYEISPEYWTSGSLSESCPARKSRR